MYSTVCVHRTVPVTCSVRLCEMSVSPDTGSAVTLAITLETGLKIVTLARSFRNFSSAEIMSREWNAPATFNGTALFIPYRFASSIALPDVLHFPGQHNLTGRIYICYVHISLLSDLPQNPFIPANKRSHGSGSRETSLFHVQAPIGDQSKPGQKVECSCCSVAVNSPSDNPAAATKLKSPSCSRSTLRTAIPCT